MRTLKHSHGVTLLELMTTLSAAALVLALGVPSFQGIQADMQRTQVSYALMGSFSLARSEAVRRGVPVTVCPSFDGATCSFVSGLDWSSGWIVTTSERDDPQLLHTSHFQGDSFALRADSNIGRAVTFASNGIPRAAGSFVYDDGQETCQLRLIPLGRLEPDQSNPACL